MSRVRVAGLSRTRSIARVDESAAFDERGVASALTDPVEQHRGGQDQRGGVGHVLAGDVGSRAVLGLRDADGVAGVDGAAQT